MIANNDGKKILLRIFKATSGLGFARLKSEFSLTDLQLEPILSSLEHLGFIIVTGQRVMISQKGVEYLVSHPEDKVKGNSDENCIPDRFHGKRIGINEFYIPLNFEK